MSARSDRAPALRAVASAPKSERRARAELPYRMKDLCDRSGLSRQVIHFYIQEGLLPEGEKTGRNMAYYSEAHLERLKLIRQLQHERFLPLRAIRAILDEEESGFSKEQRRLLLDVKHRLGPLLDPPESQALLSLREVLLRARVSREDAEEMAQLGVFQIVKKRGRAYVARDDAWMIDLWGELRAAGFSRELGFTPADFTLFAESIEAMFHREKEMLKTRLSHLSPDAVAGLVESAVPLLNQFMARYHESLVKKLFAAIQDVKEETP
jgi:DNA-binding transcriptional MerR regulator